MKRSLAFFILMMALEQLAWAHKQPPFSSYVLSAKDVYLVQVSSLDGSKITFDVIEVLKGQRISRLVLEPYPGSQNYSLMSKWLLASCPEGKKTTVGWAMTGDCGWIPEAVVEIGGTSYVKDSWTFPESWIVLDTAPDGTKGLTLAHVKELLKKAPAKK